MWPQWLRHLIRPMSSTPRKVPSRSRRFRPSIETLEDRALLATFTVSNINDSGGGSLRQAILDANGTGGLDNIAFTIAANQTISVLTALPAISEAVILDASSRPTRLNWAGGGMAEGLSIESSGSTIRGLTLTRFSNAINIVGNDNIIQNNFVGTTSTGGSAATTGNGLNGIRVLGGDGNVIGGTGAGQRNTVAFNGGAGVQINLGSRNAIRGNSIESNGGLGIDLVPTGVTPNDTGDGDMGANDLQNFPLLSNVQVLAASTRVTMFLNSTANTTFNFDFYTSPTVDPSGHGEGVTYRGALSGTTNSSGDLTLIITFPSVFPLGHYITATATPITGESTSEFSPAVRVPPTLYQFSAANYNANEAGGTTATITVTRSGDTSAAGTVRYAASDGTASAGQDYTTVSGTLNFNAGQTSATFTVPVLDDNIHEGNETVILTLSNASGLGATGGVNPATLTIADNEGPMTPRLRFLLTSSSVNENIGRATITVQRLDSTAGTATVDYAITGGTATPRPISPHDGSGDYFSTAGTVTFSPGRNTATISVNLLEDAIEDTNETIVFTLSNPTGGALLIAPDVHTLTIIDNPGFDPSARAQENLEYLNRMRLNPAAELSLLLNSDDPTVNAELTRVDQSLLMQQWASLTPTAPLAWHPALYDAAVEHSVRMLLADRQTHRVINFPGEPDEPDLGPRVSSAGYNFSTLGENVFAFTQNMFHGHAGFAIDWGPGPGGIQSPPGHRNNMMSGSFRDIGIGVVDDLPNTSTGPLLLTQDLGNRFSYGNPYLLGVVFSDANANTFYNAGEGLGGVNVAISGPGGSFNTTTWSAGGYQVQVPSGTYTVTFSGGGLLSPITRMVTVGSENVKLDAVVGSNPGQFHFSAGTYSVNENGGQATVTVTRSGGNAGVATVVLATSNGSATAGADYTAVSLTLTFADGEVSRTVTIPIVDDGLHEGNETVNLTLSNPGGGATLGSPSTAVLTITENDRFRVLTLMPTSTGFRAEFNGLFDQSVLNLYDTQTGGLGAADATLTDEGGNPVVGSLVIDPAGDRFTFIGTSGVLAMSTYSVNLRSAANGFRALATGELLDGNNDGAAGGDSTTTFAVSAPSAVVVSVPNFMRGPGQMVDVPLLPTPSTGLPLRLSNSTGITSVNLTLRYDSRLLTITGATAVPAGSGVTLNTSTPGVAIVNFTSPSPLPGGISDFVRLTALVPDSAGVLYTQKHILDLTSISINGGAIASLDDDGLHVVGYLGDTTASGGYSSTDAQRALRVAVGLDTGFITYQLADPVIIADVNESNSVTATDATRLLQESVGIDWAGIPPLPSNPPTFLVSGPDPLLSIPQNLRGRPGSTLRVPVNLDLSDGLDSANLAISYDASQLEVVTVRRGSLTGDFDLFAVNVDTGSGTIRAGLARSAGPVSGRGSGSVLMITFRIRRGAAEGATIINLRQGLGTMTTQLNEGGLDLNPDPSDEAGDVLDGVVTMISRRNPRGTVGGLNLQPKAVDDVFRSLVQMNLPARKRRA